MLSFPSALSHGSRTGPSSRAHRVIAAGMLSCLGVLSCVATGGETLPVTIPSSTEQVVLVTTDDWDSPNGTLLRLSRSGGGWVAVGHAVPVTIGRNGLAWGLGVHSAPPASPQKAEGDGRAPAGAFALGPVFGYAPEPPSGSRLPYRHSTARDYWIDDPESADYNRWVTLPEGLPNEPEKRWKSFERMRRDDHLYEIGIVVHHNTAPITKGKGSAIFLHVWRAPGVATAGCTAMAKQDLLDLIRWLDPAKKPLLIQAPGSQLGRIELRPGTGP
jgi:L,D-peptidoglycan transpeptidase YkuD (ErfK/YbiS/YcfS/YnhG family)